MRYQWWIQLDSDVAHARPYRMRNHVAVCGFYLRSLACLNNDIKPLCLSCLKQIGDELNEAALRNGKGTDE